jgi:tetratricopeptide (TPR) repeat protein
MPSDLAGHTIRNYRVESRLGSGGMGTVWLASVVKSKRGLKAGAKVAFKVLHPHLAADEGILRRFQREAGVGLTIKHDNVVATYDVGEERVDGETIYFIAMKFLAGKTLRKLLDEVGMLPEARAAALLRQAVAGVAALHEQGIVHRDLKPANLFVDERDNLCIADLGLSRLVDPHSEISLPGTFVGSAAYSAPEQIAGETVTPAADLYSLGVTVYECVTGKNPFFGSDLSSTMSNQTRLIPPPISRFAPDATYFFERVLATLLEKDPELRLQPATRLARILDEREESEWWRAYIEGGSELAQLSRARRKLRVRRATRLYGRETALATVDDAIRTAVIGRSGRIVVIGGEAGIGKSRLIDAALESRDLDPDEVRVLVSRFLDQAAATPYYALNQAIVTALEIDHLPRTERVKALPNLLRENLPERGVFAEAFALLIEGAAAVAPAKQLPPEAIPALYAEVLRTLAVRKPIVLVIEEIQWADRGSLRALEALAASLRAFPIALVLSARPNAFFETAPGEPPAAAFFQRLLAESSATRIDLARLDEAAVRNVLRDCGVPKTLAKSLAKRLHEASEGHPGFLFELIDDLERRGKLRNIKPADLKKMPLPKSIVDLLTRRLEDVDAEARRVLEFASVFGTRFKPEPVIEGLGVDVARVSSALARLEQRYHLVRAFDDAYRFDHHWLREQVYLAIDAKRRREYHAKVAEIHARADSNPHAATRANYEAGIHFSFAEDHARAVPRLIGAIWFCSERNLHERAERLARKGLDHLETADSRPDWAAQLTAGDRLELQLAAAAVYGHLGQRATQGDLLRAAARVALDAGDDRRIADVEVQLAAHVAATGRVFAALQHCERARAAAKRCGDLALEAQSLRVEAAVLETMGEIDYDDELERADELAARAGDDLGRAYGQLLLGQLHLSTDRLELALETQKQALATFERLEDQRGRGRAFFQLARVYRELGDLERAGKSIAVAAQIAEANSDGALRARSLYLAGDIAMRERRYGDAKQLLEAALAAFRVATDAAFEVYALVALSLLRSAKSNPDRDPVVAGDHAAAAVAIAQRVQLERQEAYAYAALAVAYLAQGKSRFAMAVSKKGMKFLETHHAGRKRAAELSFVHYRCAKTVAGVEAAPHLARARDLVLERAAAITDPARRASFLVNDLFTVAVLREAERVLGPA